MNTTRPDRLLDPGPTVTQTAAAELLRRAAILIDIYGWQQGDMGNRRDGWCTLGAIHHVALFNDDATLGDAIDDALRAVGEAIDAIDALDDRQIAAWNDHPDRTKTDVLTTLRQTANTLTKDHQ